MAPRPPTVEEMEALVAKLRERFPQTAELFVRAEPILTVLKEPMTTPDVRIEDHGSLVLFVPTSDAGRAWLDDHLVTEPWQMLGDSIAVEPRCALPILAGVTEAGLKWERR